MLIYYLGIRKVWFVQKCSMLWLTQLNLWMVKKKKNKVTVYPSSEICCIFSTFHMHVLFLFLHLFPVHTWAFGKENCWFMRPYLWLPKDWVVLFREFFSSYEICIYGYEFKYWICMDCWRSSLLERICTKVN